MMGTCTESGIIPYNNKCYQCATELAIRNSFRSSGTRSATRSVDRPEAEPFRFEFINAQLRFISVSVQHMKATHHPAMFLPYWILLVPLIGVSAQSCSNYGTPSGNTCICPPGFVNASSDCSLPVCGGSLSDAGLKGIQIPRTGKGFGNVSGDVCACSEGWSGPGCTGELIGPGRKSRVKCPLCRTVGGAR